MNTPLVYFVDGRPAGVVTSKLLAGSFNPPGWTSGRRGFVVLMSILGSAFRLFIDADNDKVVIQPLAPGHFLNKFGQWERFKRSNPAGK